MTISMEASVLGIVTEVVCPCWILFLPKLISYSLNSVIGGEVYAQIAKCYLE